MTKVTLEDEISVFLNRISAMMNVEHAEAFAELFDHECTVFTTHTTMILKTSDMLQNWHECVFSQLEVLQLNMQLLGCREIGSLILAEACLNFQFCYSEAPDQLEAITVRVSLAIGREGMHFKIRQMHCSLPVEHFRKDSRLSFTDPFVDD